MIISKVDTKATYKFEAKAKANKKLSCFLQLRSMLTLRERESIRRFVVNDFAEAPAEIFKIVAQSWEGVEDENGNAWNLRDEKGEIPDDLLNSIPQFIIDSVYDEAVKVHLNGSEKTIKN